MSQMNPKEGFNTVQLPYIAGHSLEFIIFLVFSGSLLKVAELYIYCHLKFSFVD